MNSNSSYKKQEVITENWRKYSKEKKSINEKKQNLDEIQLFGMNLLVSFLLSLDSVAIILDKSAKKFNKPELKIMADAARAFHPHFKKFYDEHPIITKIMLMGDIVGALKAKSMEAAINATAKAIEAEEKSASTTSSEVQQPTATPS